MIKKTTINTPEKGKIQGKAKQGLDVLVKDDMQGQTHNLEKPVTKFAAKPALNSSKQTRSEAKQPKKVYHAVILHPEVNALKKPKPKPVKPAGVSVATPVIETVPMQNKEPKVLPKIESPLVPKKAAVKLNVTKKKIQEVGPENDAYFVYLKEPMEYRRYLLDCSRKILFCLKSHQKIMLIRQKKLDEMIILKGTIRELLYLNKKFNEKLPKYNTSFLENMPSKDKATPVKAKAPVAIRPVNLDVARPVKVEKTEMEKLEESLANIERKLKSLQ